MKIVNCQVSGEYPGYPKGNAIDGNDRSIWNSGGFAPQWIELNLDEPVEELMLYWMPEMTPTAGLVTVEFLMINKDSVAIGLLKQNYQCQTGEWAETRIKPSVRQPLIEVHNHKIARIRMTVTSSPSWIALREVAVHPCVDVKIL